ncbi:hypothetical protein Tcan_01942 [Toxocara canis]|uniref:Uncharacterized protein n=1 Tax=Toxocara canis TaxID=6265 RepID=A0A0B2VFX5_TOXCA|nr:hypothetical protein Tcan_01942 [Toxocara canis]
MLRSQTGAVTANSDYFVLGCPSLEEISRRSGTSFAPSKSSDTFDSRRAKFSVAFLMLNETSWKPKRLNHRIQILERQLSPYSALLQPFPDPPPPPRPLL